MDPGHVKTSFEALGAYRPYNGESFDEMALRVYPQARTIQHVHHAGTPAASSTVRGRS